MSRFTPKLRLLLALTTPALVAVAVAACGSSKSSSSSSSAASSGASSSSGKTYVVATSADFPPMSSRSSSNPNEIIGFEPDMVKAIMGHLAWKYKYVTSDFNGLIPSVQSGRVDMVVSDIYNTAARRQIVDFVNYLSHEFAIMVTSTNAGKVHSFLDLCGKPMGILTGSAPELAAAQAGSKQCTSAGKPAIVTKSFPAVAQELPPLANGTLDAILETDVTENYISKHTSGRYKLVFELASTKTYVGVVLAKNSPTESQVRSGVKWFLSTPQYKADAAKWGIPKSNLISSS